MNCIPDCRSIVDERKGTPHRAGLLRRRLARSLYAWHQQGDPEAGPRFGRAAPHHRPVQAAKRHLRRRRRPQRSGIRHRVDYFELLRDIGRTVELRVIVDVIAGASAGGINATMLARALSHDLPMAACAISGSKMPTSPCCWRRKRVRGEWSKWIVRPLVLAGAACGVVRICQGQGGAPKLSLFLRSRWFKPPFRRPRSWPDLCTTPPSPWASRTPPAPPCCRRAMPSICS